MGADQLERLITLIENRGSLCGAAIVGHGSITFLFGHPHHASIAGSQVTGMDAVREIARMAATGEEPTWDEAVRLGAGQSVDGVPVADILDAIHQAFDAASPASASTLESPLAVETEDVVQATIEPAIKDTTSQETEREDKHPPASDVGKDANHGSAVDPGPEVAAPLAPLDGGASPVFDGPITLAGGPEDVDAEEAAAAAQTPQGAHDQPIPAPAAVPALGDEPPAASPDDSEHPPATTNDADSIPPLTAGESILDETPVTTVDLKSFLLEDAPLQVAYRSPNAEGVALVEHGHVHDALYLKGPETRYGTAAFEAIVGAREGTVNIAKIPRGVFEALPACWSGQLTTSDTPASEIDLDDLNVGVVSTLATAAIQVATRTDRGVVLYQGGRIVAAYTHSAPHRLMNEGSLASLFGDPSAFVRVRTLRAQPPASPPPPKPDAIDHEQWASTVSAMTLAVQARLHTHSGRVEEILQQAPPNRQGVATAAHVIRSTVIRGVHPATMRSLADQIESIGRARLPA